MYIHNMGNRLQKFREKTGEEEYKMGDHSRTVGMEQQKKAKTKYSCQVERVYNWNEFRATNWKERSY